MADTDKPSNMPAAGPIGRNLLAALEELAAARKISMRRLSAMLDAIGRPIPALGLSRILKAERRVDVDEATALAVVLGVNVNALLLPRHVTADDVIELAPKVHQRAGVTWAWADGRMALPPELAPEGTREVTTPGGRWGDFQKHARPDLQPQEPDPAVAELVTLIRMLEIVVPAQGRPEAWAQWRDTILRRFRLAAIQLEELFDRFDREAFADSGAAAEQLRVTVSQVREAAVPFAPGTEDRYRDNARAGRERQPGPHGAATSRVADPFGERDR